MITTSFRGKSALTTQSEGGFVQFEEFGRDALLDGLQPLLLGKVEITGEMTHQNDVHRFGAAGLLCLIAIPVIQRYNEKKKVTGEGTQS